MSEKVENLNEHRRKKKPVSIKDAVQIASQHVRNIVPDDLEEPKGLASGDDMNKTLEEDKGEEDKDEKDNDNKK